MTTKVTFIIVKRKCKKPLFSQYQRNPQSFYSSFNNKGNYHAS
jgi:hypothetical protein